MRFGGGGKMGEVGRRGGGVGETKNDGEAVGTAGKRRADRGTCVRGPPVSLSRQGCEDATLPRNQLISSGLVRAVSL